METKIENRDICKECGGFCCKKSGCDYFVSDFESLKKDYLEEVLSTGRVSIVASLQFIRGSNNKLLVNPFLSIRERNVGRDVIDLFSFKTACASLTSEGCSYDLENRPSGGATLIPKIQNGAICCYSEVDRLEELKKWAPYQDVLQKIVKRHTGMSVYNKLRQDVENVFYDILTNNFEGVNEVEILDVISGLKPLYEAYPEEYERAKARKSNKQPLVIVKNRKY